VSFVTPSPFAASCRTSHVRPAAAVLKGNRKSEQARKVLNRAKSWKSTSDFYMTQKVNVKKYFTNIRIYFIVRKIRQSE